ncbi:MAG TPA: cellulose binding domain-containing protein [Streptosporangiaceae bacterium]|nr:cellulose binding domain-containing protein [Streptosporangiaceae bacterium]
MLTPLTTARPLRRTALAALAVAVTFAMSATGVAALSAPALAADTATINGATTFQTMAGFGASEGFGEASTVMNASSAVQQQALNLLYSPTSGAGLTILRNEISADSGATIEPTNPGGPTATPNYAALASIGQDQGQLWFAQQIKARYGVTNVVADAWSAPPFMKVNGSTSGGGALCGVPGASCSSGDWRQAYANYLVQYAKDYAAAGDPLTYIGPENEANFAPSSYDGMTLSPAQTANLIDVLGPTVTGSGLSTKIECCATEGWDFAQQYAAAIEADPTANSYTPVFTSHGYTQAPTSPLSGWSKQAWETEWSTFDSWDPAWDDGSDASGLTWAQHIYTGLTASNLSAFLYWWGSTTPAENGDNEGLIQINGSTVAPSGRLWAFANYSRYVQPGAVRIAATSSNSAVDLTAFKNTDGSVSIVALNTASSADPITYSLAGTGTASGATVTPYLTNASSDAAAQATTTVSGSAFSATIPARSLVTYVIPAGSGGGGGGGNTVTVTSPGNQSGAAGTAASLQIQATDSGTGQTLSYAAGGLPAGLSINSGTGLISGTPTTAGAATVTVTVTDGTGASGSATFTWTISGGGGGGGSTCSVSYTTQSQWAGGFVASVIISNPGSSAISGWKLGFTFPGDQKITNSWSGSVTQSGENVSITNASYNPTIAPGSSTSLGFQGTWTTSDAAPTTFTLNGATCTG